MRATPGFTCYFPAPVNKFSGHLRQTRTDTARFKNLKKNRCKFRCYRENWLPDPGALIAEILTSKYLSDGYRSIRFFISLSHKTYRYLPFPEYNRRKSLIHLHLDIRSEFASWHQSC